MSDIWISAAIILSVMCGYMIYWLSHNQQDNHRPKCTDCGFYPWRNEETNTNGWDFNPYNSAKTRENRN